MNINQLNRITAINIEEKLANVKANSGTFKELLDNVMDGTIIPIVNNAGLIIGLNFNTNVTNLIDDCIEQRKFEIKYADKPLPEWFEKTLKIKADGKEVSEVIETIQDGIKVVMQDGEIVEIEAPAGVLDRYEYADVKKPQKEQLPSEIYIPISEVEDAENEMKGIKKYLRNTYGHYLSGQYGDPEVEEVEDPEDGEEMYHVSSIHWGRKI